MLSIDIPIVISLVGKRLVEGLSVSMSISGAALFEFEISRFTLKIALSFPGPIPPRNLKGGASLGVGLLGEGGSDM